MNKQQSTQYKLFTVLLIIMIVLILFIVMYYKYDMSNINNIQRFSNIEKMSNNTELLEMMKEAQEKAKEQIQQIIQLSKNTNNKSHIENTNKPKSNEKFEEQTTTTTPITTPTTPITTPTTPITTPTTPITTTTTPITTRFTRPIITRNVRITTTTTKPNLVDQDTYYRYGDKLDNTQDWLNNRTAELFKKIQEKLNDYNTNRTNNKAEIIDLLTNIYVINYIYKFNKDNAEVYKVYMKYNDPKKNMYYKSYLD
jgi:hypothetical protein